jgi:DNA-directed RNA polymerase specialized sigma24 family protein
MSGGYVISVDPAELATRFASQDPLFDDIGDPVEEEAITEPLISTLNYENQIKPLLNRIPEREADLIDLYYLHKKRQADIAVIFGVTQAAISYRLDRGLQRIRFLLSIPQVSEEEMRRDLPDVPFKPIDVDILIGMWLTTCQSEVASRLGLTQGRVRHRFFGAVKTLERKASEDSRFEPYSKIFVSIASKNFNVLREVKLPQWSNRGGDGCY